jgi:1,4-alpha-glucan branching enzyme
MDDGVLLIPAPHSRRVRVRWSLLPTRDQLDEARWTYADLEAADTAGFFRTDLKRNRLPDGDYEYEFVLDDDIQHPVPDPFAEVLSRFDGYRALFTVRGGRILVLPPFTWEGEIRRAARLPQNNESVIYELPVRWMTGEEGSDFPGIRQVDLGTFESTLFGHLSDLAELGINAVEIMPCQDSPDTLNWGYGTRFFFAPDFDMGSPADLRLLVKSCHRLGMRVILDVVMNHSRGCPLETLAHDWYYLRDDEDPSRMAWGGQRFRYAQPAVADQFLAREFHYQMAAYWIRNYHIDGFRIDDFADINNWDFIQGFRDRSWQVHADLFPDRPFIVIIEDSQRRAVVTQDRGPNPNNRRTADAEWNFSYQQDVRLLLRNQLQPQRRARLEAALSGRGVWDGSGLREGFTDLAQTVEYLTSHDVQDVGAQRWMSVMLRDQFSLWEETNAVAAVKRLVDSVGSLEDVPQAYVAALDRVRGAFAVLLTSVGIPMFLAGEEFADVHDLDPGNWPKKMSDPVDWERARYAMHRRLREHVRDLVNLRTSHPALQRDEVDFFYYHPSFDSDQGEHVFAYCRTNGRALGDPSQVVVVANCGSAGYGGGFVLPWRWAAADEVASPMRTGSSPIRTDGGDASVPLLPYDIRVFATR